jgi:hypothetical protein
MYKEHVTGDSHGHNTQSLIVFDFLLVTLGPTQGSRQEVAQAPIPSCAFHLRHTHAHTCDFDRTASPDATEASGVLLKAKHEQIQFEESKRPSVAWRTCRPLALFRPHIFHRSGVDKPRPCWGSGATAARGCTSRAGFANDHLLNPPEQRCSGKHISPLVRITCVLVGEPSLPGRFCVSIG